MRMGELADPGTADWMAPEQPTGPQPVAVDPRLRLPAQMGGLAAMDPGDVRHRRWIDHDRRHHRYRPQALTSST